MKIVTPTGLPRFAGQTKAVGVLIQAPKITTHQKPPPFDGGLDE